MTNYNQESENSKAKASYEPDNSHTASDEAVSKETHYLKPNEVKYNLQKEQTEHPDSFKFPVEEERPRPPDGGWGWMVAVGCFVITSLLPMVGPCFGILFSRYLLSSGTSSTTTAWIFNTQCFIWNGMGLITRPLTQEFGWRKIGILGAFLASVSIIISAFAPDPTFLFFSFSLLSGTGGGTVTSMCFTILPNYFDRHRGIANGIMMAGICLGQVVAPPLVQFLQEQYGFQGATMIIGALMLNACIGASFFHPVEWHSGKTKTEKPHTKPEGKTSLLPENESRLNGTGSGFRASRSVISFRDLKESQSSKSLGDAVGREAEWVEIITHARRLRRRQSRRISDLSHVSVASSLAVSTMDVAGVGAGYAEKESSEASSSNLNQKESRSVFDIIARVARSTVSDLKILRSPRALIIALGATFCINGYINFIMMVPFAMQVEGFSLESSAWCVSASAICNLLMRLLTSALSDWPKFSVKACYVSGFVVIFISNLVFPFLRDERWMLAVMSLWGCGVGMNMGVYNLVMISVMGLDNLAPVFGASCFMVAMGFVTFGPLIGVVRDATQSYYVSMWMVSGMILTSLILWLFMPAAHAYDLKKAQESKVDSKLVDP